MSLSKYYKDSSSFKRDELVQSSSADQTGWKPKTNSSASPFKPGPATPPQEQNSLPRKPTPDPDIINKTSPSPSDIPPRASTQNEKPSRPNVDLSNYVSLEDAEANALERYQQGIQDGIEKAHEDFGSALKMLTSTSEQLDTIRETIIGNSSDELTEFAILIAEKIIRISLKDQDESIIATIQEALSRAVKSDEFTIFIHPDDYQIISDKSADLISTISGLNNIVLKTDPTIEQGGVKIESENCIIDATVASQFEAIRDEIRKTNE